SYIPLLDFLANKKAIINIKNNDNKCFKYCILAGLKLPNKNPQEIYHYNRKEYENLFNDKEIEYPVKLSNIPKIEKMNNIKIIVYGYLNEKEAKNMIFQQDFIYYIMILKIQMKSVLS